MNRFLNEGPTPSGSYRFSAPLFVVVDDDVSTLVEPLLLRTEDMPTRVRAIGAVRVKQLALWSFVVVASAV